MGSDAGLNTWSRRGAWFRESRRRRIRIRGWGWLLRALAWCRCRRYVAGGWAGMGGQRQQGARRWRRRAWWQAVGRASFQSWVGDAACVRIFVRAVRAVGSRLGRGRGLQGLHQRQDGRGVQRPAAICLVGLWCPFSSRAAGAACVPVWSLCPVLVEWQNRGILRHLECSNTHPTSERQPDGKRETRHKARNQIHCTWSAKPL